MISSLTRALFSEGGKSVGHFIEEILREAIFTEKSSYDFCHLAASVVSDDTTREVFSDLAQEGLEHARQFLILYTGSEFACTEILNQRQAPDDETCNELLQSVQEAITEQRALEIALSEEQGCIDRYSVFVTKIREPKYKEAFDQALYRSRKQYEVIEREYSRVLEKSGEVPLRKIVNS